LKPEIYKSVLASKLCEEKLRNLFLAKRECKLEAENIQECSCFEIMNIRKLRIKHETISDEEYNKHYVSAAKLHHPDRFGSQEAMMHLNACRELLYRDPKFKEQKLIYVKKLGEIKEECGKEQMLHRRTRCLRKKISDLHSCGSQREHLCLLRLGGQKDQPDPQEDDQPEDQPDPLSERMLLVLDSSASMRGWKLSIGKRALYKMFARVERTPTQVHLIGRHPYEYDENSKRILDFSDKKAASKIDQRWDAKASGTYLWEYLYEVLSEMKVNEPEVVIITDGCDNDSKGKFSGGEGFIEVMNRLVKEQIKPRFRILFVGMDACIGNNEYRNLAYASGGSYAHIPENSENEEAYIQKFADEVTASHAKRLRIGVKNQDKYQLLIAAGDAPEYEFVEKVKLSSKGAQSVDEESVEVVRDPLDTRRAELEKLKLRMLIKAAEAAGVPMHEMHKADHAADDKAAYIDLILKYEEKLQADCNIGSKVEARVALIHWTPRQLKNGDIGEIVGPQVAAGEWQIEFDGVRGSLTRQSFKCLSPPKH
jgi:Mg-chelatase subunit ChlD